MKTSSANYDFRIDALTPETLRLNRFVDYVSALRGIFANTEDVYFEKVRRGSAVLQFGVVAKAVPRVEKRLRLLGSADMPPDMAQQWTCINRLLRRDGASARLSRKGGAVLAEFAGIRTPLAQEAIVHENGTIDGIVVGVKGVDDSVSIWLKTDDGALQKCNAKRDIARRLAPLFDTYVRVAGKGRWRRGDDALLDWPRHVNATFHPRLAAHCPCAGWSCVACDHADGKSELLSDGRRPAAGARTARREARDA